MNISKTISTIIVVSMVASFGFCQKGRSRGSKSSGSLFPSIGKSSSSGSIFGGKNGGDVYVKGYTKKDGTYVAPHMRSSKDGVFDNNWTTKGNYNPYTFKDGTKISPNSTNSGTIYRGYNYSSSLIAPAPISPKMLSGRTLNSSQEFFSIGSSKEDVLRIMGKPDRKEIMLRYLECLDFGDDYVMIDVETKKVYYFKNNSGKLKVK